MVGYTTGSQSSPLIMWSKNLLRKPTALFDIPTNLREFDFNCSSIFALMWNMMQRQLLTEVLDDLKDFSTKYNMAMDAAGVMDSYYEIQDGNGVYYEFHNTELAPPHGNFAKKIVQDFATMKAILPTIVLHRKLHDTMQYMKEASSLLLIISVDHGSHRGGSPWFLGTPYHTPPKYFKLPQQLSIWIFIPHQSVVYKTIALRRGERPPVVRFWIRPIPVASRATTYEKYRFMPHCRTSCDVYWSYGKSGMGKWLLVWFWSIFVYITWFWHQ